ncbi:MAG: hypothetical protein BKP49_04855 [Treponema sp. CETP13]|nr:MAG: hypothetical protein BKP49_04855 [Treponema sp. CETP13]
MEELRSTEILDREILEDARKKSERVLVKSEKDAQKVLEGVSVRLEAIKKEKNDLYENKIKHFKEELEASLPLKKQRFLVSFEDEAVSKAIYSYIDSLKKEDQIAIVRKLLLRYKNVLNTKKVHVTVSGFEVPEMENLINTVLGAGSVLSCKKMAKADEKALSIELGNTKGAVIETDDRSVECRAVIGELINEISDKYSYELTSTLFGGRLPE